MSLVILFNNKIPPPKGFIGSIDNIVVRNSFTQDVDIKRRYEVALKNPNEYQTMLWMEGYSLFWTCSQAAPIVDLYQTVPDDGFNLINTIQATLTEGFSESESFAITPYKNKISFVFMDSDSVPRDQLDLENDEELEGDPQLVPTGLPYRGIVALEWDDDSAKMSLDAHAIDPNAIFGPNQVWDVPALDLYSDYTLRLNFDGEFGSIDLIKDGQLKYSEGDVTYSDRQVVFSTNKFPLDFRVRGSIGWSASLFDTNSYVNYVNTENLGFAEYRSTQIRSQTPYSGVQIFPSESPPAELVGSFSASEWGGQIQNDDDKSDSGVAFKVSTSGDKRFEGIKTNNFFVKTPDDIRIEFKTQSSVPLDIFLYSFSDDRIIPIRNKSMFASKGWSLNQFTVTSPSGAGYYALYITSSQSGVWYVDNVSVKVPSISWFARSRPRDKWIPFKDVSGTEYGGVMFGNKGTDLQIKAISRFNESTISGVQIQPKESEIGNIVWPDEVHDVNS